MSKQPLQVRLATSAEQEAQKWNQLVSGNPAGGDFLHTNAFARVKQAYGWRPLKLVWCRGEQVISACLALEWRVPLLGRYWYLPHGPGVATLQDLQEHVAALSKFISEARKNVFALLIEPQIVDEWEASPSTRELCEKAISDSNPVWSDGIQPNVHTALVDIDKSDEDLIASFSSSCRTKVRKAARRGAVVERVQPTPEVYRNMHSLQRQAGRGTGAAVLRSDRYAELFWDCFTEEGLGQFYQINNENGDPAVMTFGITVGSRSFYKDGGSVRERIEPGMAYLMQYEMMRDGRDAGAKVYDMIGTASRKDFDNPNARLYSLGAFKISFSREITDFVGAWHLVRSKLKFRLWQRLGSPLMHRWYRFHYKDRSWY